MLVTTSNDGSCRVLKHADANFGSLVVVVEKFILVYQRLLARTHDRRVVRFSCIFKPMVGFSSLLFRADASKG